MFGHLSDNLIVALIIIPIFLFLLRQILFEQMILLKEKHFVVRLLKINKMWDRKNRHNLNDREWEIFLHTRRSISVTAYHFYLKELITSLQKRNIYLYS